MPFGRVIHPGYIGFDSGGQVAGDGVPSCFVHRPGRSVVTARGAVFVWNLGHVPKLVPNVPPVDAPTAAATTKPPQAECR